MKRALSTVRENTPFATPPRVLVMAEAGCAGEAVALADALEELGAEAEVRFGEGVNVNHNLFAHGHLDAVIVAGTRGYSVARHHPILGNVLSRFAARSGR